MIMLKFITQIRKLYNVFGDLFGQCLQNLASKDLSRLSEPIKELDILLTQVLFVFLITIHVALKCCLIMT